MAGRMMANRGCREDGLDCRRGRHGTELFEAKKRQLWSLWLMKAETMEVMGRSNISGRGWCCSDHWVVFDSARRHHCEASFTEMWNPSTRLYWLRLGLGRDERPFTRTGKREVERKRRRRSPMPALRTLKNRGTLDIF